MRMRRKVRPPQSPRLTLRPAHGRQRLTAGRGSPGLVTPCCGRRPPRSPWWGWLPSAFRCFALSFVPAADLAQLYSKRNCVQCTLRFSPLSDFPLLFLSLLPKWGVGLFGVALAFPFPLPELNLRFPPFPPASLRSLSLLWPLGAPPSSLLSWSGGVLTRGCVTKRGESEGGSTGGRGRTQSAEGEKERKKRK